MNMRQRWIPVGAMLVLVAIIGGMLLALGLPSGGSAAPASVPSTQTSTNRTLTSQGQGEIRLQPNQASIVLGVETRAQDAQSAVTTNTTKMNAVIAAMRGQGIGDRNMQSTNLSLHYDAERSMHVAMHNLTIRLDDINKVAQTLDTAVGAGANSSWGVTFGLKDPSVARSQALKAAIADARKHADDMAAALGMRVTGVASAEEVSYGYGSRDAMPGTGAGGGLSTIQPGELAVTANVRVAYALG